MSTPVLHPRGRLDRRFDRRFAAAPGRLARSAAIALCGAAAMLSAACSSLGDKLQDRPQVAVRVPAPPSQPGQPGQFGQPGNPGAPGASGAPAPSATPTAITAVAPLAAPGNGSIYVAGSARGLFEDRRARMAGDILTIQVQEKTSAKQSSNTSLARDTKLSGSITALPLLPSSLLGRAKAGAASNNELDAKGATGSDADFTGMITVTVIEVLSNGNLVVSGEKQIGINQNVDTMRFSGVVNPASILPGNVVSSTQVADARLEYRGRGDMDKAQTTGWLSRFFLSWFPI